MKKLLAMLIAAFALGTAVGCGGSSSTPAAVTKPGATGTTGMKPDDKKPEEPKKEEPKKEEPKKEEPKKEEPKKEEPKKEEPKK